MSNFLLRSNDRPNSPTSHMHYDRYGQGSSSFPIQQRTFQPSNYASSSDVQDVHLKPEDPMATLCFTFADVASKYLIAHPCMVLRRQCQVHQSARSLHLTPFTLVPVVCHIISNEGPLTLWKGAIGNGVVWGLSAVTEIAIADVFGFPRNIVQGGSTEKFWRHVWLKAITAFSMMPFHISSFIETVRSESGLGSDDSRVTDVLTRGIDRLRFDFFGAKDSSRRFSVLHLAIPGVAYYTSHFLLSHYVQNYLTSTAKRYVSRKPPNERTTFHTYMPQMVGQMGSVLITDILLYPFSTILHRLYIQGTRTLIDNLDTGTAAISITVKYSGILDCFKSVVKNEGFWALYSGFGALALQCVLNFMLLRLVRSVFDHGREALQISTVPVVSSTHSSAPSSHFNNPSHANSAFLASPTHPGANISRYVPPPQPMAPDYYHTGGSVFGGFPGPSTAPTYDVNAVNAAATGDMTRQPNDRHSSFASDDLPWNVAQSNLDKTHGF
uniref:Solute carrier family 25 member 46 n=1 Tax=Steinernema glaseri TaxID=37863 RepID=A0A1I8ALU2_9BILA